MVNLFQDKTNSPAVKGCEGFAPQTIQRYLSNIQLDKCNAERLKGFSGKIMRIGKGGFILRTYSIGENKRGCANYDTPLLYTER